MKKFLCISFFLILPCFLNASDFTFLCSLSDQVELQKTFRAIHNALVASVDDQEEYIDCANLKNFLEACESLDLSDSDISDLRPLSNLKNLRTINLSNNRIQNLWNLRNLPDLEVLILENNDIVDISALVDFPNLSIVNLNNNQIKNILPLKDLYNLDRALIENNPVLDDEDELAAQAIRDYLESLIGFRKLFQVNDYEALDFSPKNFLDSVAILNNRAARGDLDYFRLLFRDEKGRSVFESAAIRPYLGMHTIKILLAISESDSVARNLYSNFLEAIRSLLQVPDSLNDLDQKTVTLYGQILEHANQILPYTQRVIQYFIAQDLIRPPYQKSDLIFIEDALRAYVEKYKTFAQQSGVSIATFKVFYSPTFILRELLRWGDSAIDNFQYTLRSGSN